MSAGVREFAREIGISAATLSRIERGKLPDIETFGKLCSVLKLDPADILEIEDIEANQPPPPQQRSQQFISRQTPITVFRLHKISPP